nr:hypothetical protein [Tanacetum cinerariifolium]
MRLTSTKKKKNRFKIRKKEEEENMAAFLSQRKTNTFCVHKNSRRKVKKPTLKPRFMEERVYVVSTEMIDEGKEHAKTEDPHEDVGKLEKYGDNAMITQREAQLENELSNLASQRQLLASVNYRLAVIEELERLSRNLVAYKMREHHKPIQKAVLVEVIELKKELRLHVPS